MEYPRKVMRKKELRGMGFSEAYLMRIFRTVGTPVAWKMNPGARQKNSPILFDTEELEKVRARGI